MSATADKRATAMPGRREHPTLPGLDVVEALRRLELLRPAEIVAEGLVVRDLSRRNRVYLVCGPLRVSVKMPGSEVQSHTVEREWRALTWLADRSRRIAPQILAWDPTRNALVTRLLDGESLADRMRRLGRVQPRVATGLGALLGTLHSQPERPRFPAEPPGVLRLHRPDPGALGRRTAGQIELLRMLQGTPAACSALDAAAHDWRTSAAIHGDVKWEHVFVGDGVGVDDAITGLVDWECFGCGDPCWDVGCALASAMRDGLVMAAMSAASAWELVGGADLALIEAQPAITAAWRGWEGRMGLTGSDAIETRRRTMSFMGARLLQFANDIAGGSTRLPAPAALTAQVGINFLNVPWTRWRCCLPSPTRR